MAKKLYLLDGTALVYRAFFALSRIGFTNKKGEPTGAVFGFANTMNLLLKDEQPDYLGVVFDPPGDVFRNQMYPEYKANRAPMPDELRLQIPWVKELVSTWPAAVLEVEGVEADDVIGAYAAQLAGPDLEVIAVTSDKDFYQLLNEHVRILNPGRGGSAAVEARLLGPDDIPEKFGVTEPGQVIDVLALMGDTSDNVPGVPGVGPKTAGKLVAEYGSLEKIYENQDKLKPTLRDKLVSSKDQVMLSRELVTIRTDLELPIPLEGLTAHPPGGERLLSFLDRMNLQRFRQELGAETLGKETPEPPQLFDRHHSYVLVSDPDSLQKLVKRISEASEGIVIETESSSVYPMRGELLGIAVALAASEGFYINLGHRGETSPLSLAQVQAALGPLLADENIPKIAHDAKHALLVLDRAGMSLCGLTFDTLIASYLLDPEGTHRLDALSQEELGERIIPVGELTGTGAKKKAMVDIEAEHVAPYAAGRADMTFRLKNLFLPRLSKFGLDSLFEKVEMPLLHVLGKMEQTGVALDVDFLTKMSARLARELDRLETECHRSAGDSFNVNSPRQLAEILFERLNLPRGKRIKTGYSTDSEVLEGLKPHHDLPGLVLEYRQIAKLKSTYVDSLPEMIHPETGRIHGSFNQTVAATGRLSSSDPNLQNIPIRTPLGREVRKAFVPGEEGWVLVSADYSQIELRIMAHLSRDPALREAFQEDADIHRDTAARLFGLPPEEVTELQRGQAKTVNFGVLYGQGPYGLARTLGITTGEARTFIASYKTQYAGVMAYLEKILVDAKRKGYVTTLLNRRRYLPGLKSTNVAARAGAERLAINTPIQGSAADLIKVAMVELDHQLTRKKLSARLLLQVHDELVLECPKRETTAVRELVTKTMQQALELDVPIRVNFGVGSNWAEIH